MQSDNFNYKAIARRFRPRTFKEVTGQDAVVATLKNAIRQKKVGHAYLFAGIRGTGKTTLARLFAKAINCEHLTSDYEPCNECSSCKEIATGQSLDVIEIDGASNRGIDDIRNINETLGYATFKNRAKIFIIDEVHMLTKEAFNALLKSLEEPPANVKFFLATTEPQKLLPTITSRCQRFELLRIQPAAIIQKLRFIARECGVEIEDDALSLITRLSEGSLRDAESLLDQLICLGEKQITVATITESLGFVTKEALFHLDEAYSTGDTAFSFEFAGKLFGSGKDMTFFIDILFEHFRNIALLLLGKITLASPLFSEAERTGYTRSLQIYTLPKVLHILEYLSKLTLEQPKTSFKRIHLEMTLLYIIQSKQRITIEELVTELNKLKDSAETRGPLPTGSHGTIPALELPPGSSHALRAPLGPSPTGDHGTIPAADLHRRSSETRGPSPGGEHASIPAANVHRASAETLGPSPAPAPTPVLAAAPISPHTHPSPPSTIRQETLLRFAAVELNGIVKKHS